MDSPGSRSPLAATLVRSPMMVSLACLARIICPIVAALPLLLQIPERAKVHHRQLGFLYTGYRVGRGIGFLKAGSPHVFPYNREKCTDVVNPQLRLLERGEVPAARRRCEVHNVVSRFGRFACFDA